MQRIVIFGNSGSGKSTLAKVLCAEHALAHLDLDSLAWTTSNPPTRAPLAQSEQAIRAFLATHNQWVIEGCYSDLLALVAAEASRAIFLNPGVEQCIANCRARPWEPHKYPSPAAQDRNLPMLIDWVKQYPARTDVFSLKSHRALYDGFAGEKQEYQSNTAIA